MSGPPLSAGTGTRPWHNPRCPPPESPIRLAAVPPFLAIATAAALVTAVPARPDDPPAGSVPPDQDPFYSASADIGTYADAEFPEAGIQSLLTTRAGRPWRTRAASA
ncbi:hypothetical protein [Actinomadura bangladeshensis]|uniref:hypothetical protein n=1 Tax=Actinomadura bangladeshensis TaxID=453573 RepID=UPI0031D7E1BB